MGERKKMFVDWLPIRKGSGEPSREFELTLNHHKFWPFF